MPYSDTQLREYIDGGADPVATLAAELLALRTAIRAHQHKSGHELCWINDRELWHCVDPQAQYPHGSLPVREEFLGQCARYYESRLTGTPYAEATVRQPLAASSADKNSAS